MDWKQLSRDVARETGCDPDFGFSQDGQHPWVVAAIRIATLKEREACAKTCEALWQEEATAAANGTQEPKYHDCIECAYAIRERSNAEVS